MLTDIYARTMITATRQTCVKLRDLPAPKPLPLAAGRIARIRHWLAHRSVLTPRRSRCVHPLKL